MKKISLLILLLFILAFTTGDYRSVYVIPHSAGAVCAVDIDLDGDHDIVISHSVNLNTLWGGIYILQNDGSGHLTFRDSIFEVAGSRNIYAENVFSDIYPDIVSANSQYVNILSFDGEEYTQCSFVMGDQIREFALGDVDNDNDLDIVFCSGNNRYWGIIHNLNKEYFSEPIYYYLDFPPIGITCGDLDNNGYADIAISGRNTTIYFSNSSGFDSLALKSSSTEIDIVDFDGDYDFDLITFSEIISLSSVYIYENKGHQVFDSINSFSVLEGLSDMFLGDFDNDSLNDILFMPFTDFTKYILYTNLGDFNFSDPIDIPTEFYSGELRKYFNCSDMDGNGFLDIIASHNVYMPEYPGIADILFNDGHGNFVDNPLESVEEILSGGRTGFINYPNPFTTSTTFEFTIENESQIEIIVYDLMGNLVKSLTNKAMKGGTHKIKWNGLNNASQTCKSGFHIAFLKVNGTSIQSIKILAN